MVTSTLTVRAEYTPNPNSLKFIVSENLMDFMGSFTYASASEASAVANALAEGLFSIQGITKVFIMSNL